MLVPVPEEPIAWSDVRLRGAWVVLLAAAALALSFLPRLLINNDEFSYAGQALTLANGHLTPRWGEPLMIPGETVAQAFRYPVAWPLVLAIGRWVAFRGMFVIALLAHLVGGAAVARMLVRRGIRSELVAVYVFHPVFWLYSRTLLSDMPAMVGMLVAMDGWENRSRVSSGLSLGFSSAARLANAVVVLGFAPTLLRDLKRRWIDVAALAVGVLAFLAVQMFVNQTLGGYWLVSHYVEEGGAMIKAAMLLENLVLYVGGLALLPPFSLVFAVARLKHVDRWAWIALAVVASHLLIAYHQVSARWIETLVGGQRYVIPAHAALLVATSRIWSRLPVFRRTWWTLPVGAAGAVAICLAMTRVEARYRPATDIVAACRPQSLAFNRYANRIAGSVQVPHYKSMSGAETGALLASGWDVMILAPGLQSNQPGFSTAWPDGPPSVQGARCQLIGAYAIYDRTSRCPSVGEACVPGR